ncbi:MAG: cytochrome c4 [Gammaproteobacteria bacterium HGW-Gammaproteobacteria-3]|nr:MAG: cytochrome c4 [Gammaproteobacteria bacterium HGW-Gammaproteobacteria-3]
MRITKSLIVILSCFLALPATAADIKAGEQKAQACTACHGPQGNSGNGQFPSLAGQQALYLEAQIKAFKEGARKNPMMGAIAAGLNDEDIDNLAAYYASQKPKSAGGDQKLAQQGAAKFNMCMGCHGSSAEGRGVFPRLAGQQPDYIVKQLKDFKAGTRKGGPMSAMAANLSDDDIKALAAYLGSL